MIETMTAEFDPTMLEDHYRAVVIEILRTKQAKIPLQTTAAPPPPDNVVNLMEALRRSIAEIGHDLPKAGEGPDALTKRPPAKSVKVRTPKPVPSEQQDTGGPRRAPVLSKQKSKRSPA